MIFVACILMFLLTLIFRANYVIKKEYVFFQDLHLVTSRKFTKLYFAVSTKLVVLLPKHLIIWLSNLIVPDEGYSKNASCALN
jgi:hypothetical protein